MPLSLHVFWTLKLVLLGQFLSETSIIQLMERVESNRPVTFHYEVNLCHVDLFLIHVAVLGRRLELARHKAKSYLVQKVCIELPTHLKKQFECWHCDQIFKQEFTHDVLLNFEGNRVEVAFTR